MRSAASFGVRKSSVIVSLALLATGYLSLIVPMFSHVTIGTNVISATCASIPARILLGPLAAFVANLSEPDDAHLPVLPATFPSFFFDFIGVILKPLQAGFPASCRDL
jgi:hypothetical protein